MASIKDLRIGLIGAGMLGCAVMGGLVFQFVSLKTAITFPMGITCSNTHYLEQMCKNGELYLWPFEPFFQKVANYCN